MTDIAIHAAGLSRRFGAIRAVKDLTLSVPRGIIFGFLGPNGSGKTTTIRLLLGLLAPDAGEASVLGHDVRRESQRIREVTGALLEHHGLYERLDAEANLDFYGRAARLPSAERRRRIHENMRYLSAPVVLVAAGMILAALDVGIIVLASWRFCRDRLIMA